MKICQTERKLVTIIAADSCERMQVPEQRETLSFIPMQWHGDFHSIQALGYAAQAVECLTSPLYALHTCPKPQYQLQVLTTQYTHSSTGDDVLLSVV